MSKRTRVAEIQKLEIRRLLAAASNAQIVSCHPNDSTLVLIDLASNQTPIDAMVHNPEAASYSPDRTKILYDGHNGGVDGSYEIFTINVDGTGFKALTSNSNKDYRARFSPDGSKIVFVSDRDGNDEIYVMNADGSNAKRLTNDSGADEHPSFSPDGKRILFDSNRSGNYEIYTIDSSDGGNLTRLTNNLAADTEPSFSPDGGRIVFSSDRTNPGNTSLWVMDARGSLAGFFPTHLTNLDDRDEYADIHASFSPDGTQIVYQGITPAQGALSIINADDGGDAQYLLDTVELNFSSWASAPRFSGLANGVMVVNGTAAADSITVTTEGDLVTATLNGKKEFFDAEAVKSIQIFAGAGNDVVSGDANSRAFYASGDAGDDKMIGGAGNDTLTGGAGKNTLFGGDGDDRLNGSSGRDFLYGEVGNDRLYGNAGNDYMVGGPGVDRMWGGDGDDLLSGNSGNDKMFGEAGNDQLLGGDGNDICYGGLGIDTLNGGKGTDSSDGDDADVRIQIEVVP